MLLIMHQSGFQMKFYRSIIEHVILESFLNTLKTEDKLPKDYNYLTSQTNIWKWCFRSAWQFYGTVISDRQGIWHKALNCSF